MKRKVEIKNHSLFMNAHLALIKKGNNGPAWKQQSHKNIICGSCLM
jgi:hypothetical protein